MRSHKAFVNRTGFTSFSGVRHSLRLSQKKKISNVPTLPIKTWSREAKQPKPEGIFFLPMLPSISGGLGICSTSSHTRSHIEGGYHLTHCLSPRQREKGWQSIWLWGSLEKSTSTHILLPKHIPKLH